MSVSTPIITPALLGYDLVWEEEHIKIEVRRIRTSKGDYTTAEITIFRIDGDNLHQLKRCLHNLLAPRSASSLATELNKLYDQVAWGTILDHMSTYVLDSERKGEPMILLRSSDAKINPPEYILEPFIVKGVPNVIFGESGSHKSTIAALLGITCTFPWTDNPMGWRAPATRRKVAYLDWEEYKDNALWKIGAIADGTGLGYVEMPYRRCKIPLAEDLDQIAYWLEDFGAEITIIDGLGMAAGGDQNSSELAIRFWSAWRQLNTTSLIVGHTTKSRAEGKANSIFGSMYYTAESRNNWEVTYASHENGLDYDVCLTHRKAPSFDRKRSPIGLHISYAPNNGGVSFHQINPADIPEFTSSLDGLGTQDQITSMLNKYGPMNKATLLDELGIGREGRGKIDTAISRMADRKVVRRNKDGEYELVTKR